MTARGHDHHEVRGRAPRPVGARRPPSSGSTTSSPSPARRCATRRTTTESSVVLDVRDLAPGRAQPLSAASRARRLACVLPRRRAAVGERPVERGGVVEPRDRAALPRAELVGVACHAAGRRRPRTSSSVRRASPRRRPARTRAVPRAASRRPGRSSSRSAACASRSGTVATARERRGWRRPRSFTSALVATKYRTPMSLEVAHAEVEVGDRSVRQAAHRVRRRDCMSVAAAMKWYGRRRRRLVVEALHRRDAPVGPVRAAA